MLFLYYTIFRFKLTIRNYNSNKKALNFISYKFKKKIFKKKNFKRNDTIF